MARPHDQLRTLMDELTDEDAARVLAFAWQVRQEADLAHRNARQPRCWSCGRPRDYAQEPICSTCYAPDRRSRS